MAETDAEPDVNQLFEVGTLCSIDKIVHSSRWYECYNSWSSNQAIIPAMRYIWGKIEAYEEENTMDDKSFMALMEEVRDSTLELMHSSNDIKAERYTLKNNLLFIF